MNKPIKSSASSAKLFTDLSDRVSNAASIWAATADARYRALAGASIELAIYQSIN